MDKEEKPMSKSWKKVIIPVAAAAVFAVGIVVVNNIDVPKKSETGADEEIYTIYSEDADNIDNVNVVTESGSIKAVNLGNSVWTINDLTTEDVDPSKAYTLAGTVASLTSKHKISEDMSNLAQYGLDNPDITVTITKKNGDADKLYVGDMSPTLGEYFVMLDGGDAVYTMYSFKADTLRQPLSFYQEFNRFNIDIDDIRDVRLDRSDGTIEIKLVDNVDVNTNNVWEMVSPYKGGANDDYIDDKILEPIGTITLNSQVDGADSGITADSPRLTLAVHPYDNTTGKYGEEYTEELIIGKSVNGETYVKYRDRTYLTPADSVSFVNDSAFNIVSKLQALVDISKVKSVKVEHGGKTHTIDIEHKDHQYTFELDGKESDSDVSQGIYQSVMALAVDSVYRGDAIGDETLLKITFDGIKSEDDTVVEIKPIDDINCALVRNGEVNFTIKKSKVTDFIKNFDEYVKNPTSE